MGFNEQLAEVIKQHDKEIRNNAIEECIQKVKEMYAFTISEEEQFDKIAEKMKEQ